MKSRIVFCLIFLLLVFNLHSAVPGYINLYGGLGAGVDNFNKDLFFYERLKYSFFGGTGFNINKYLAIGGEYNVDIRFLNSYTPYGKEFASTVKDTRYNSWNPTSDLQYFTLFDISNSFRVYLNYFFIPNTLCLV